ncbi:MAG TPA: hypothetical protein VFQ65_14665 [Kofleriaceae bacterium]|nr:hypothetical protein [Kofleriaceae bacterium]
MTDAGLGLVIGFVLVVVATLAFVGSAVRSASPRAVVPIVLAACAWLGVLAVLALRGVFDHLPPPAAGAPLLVVIVVAQLVPAGRRFCDRLPLVTLTYLHLVRAGVEFCLFGLAMDHLLPTEMTFAGSNFDIAVGFTAPVFGNLGFPGGAPARGPLVIWNLIALGLLAHVVGQAALAHPHVILEWPWIWLPGFVVPIVAGAHLITLRRLISKR